ncbi:hypothetical protein LAH08_03067 [Micromonospora noduli]|uniref:Uncharacterized protein n=1 Tax=Micromonospora noduli TaxID=709876 RepID=A0A328N9Q3_9ACTN|nr:hypothetical protein LAH08_03067 [Micromonospora noduli]
MAHPAAPWSCRERGSFSEDDYIAFLDQAHQRLQAPIVLIWDNLNTHVSRRMHALIAARPWLTVIRLPCRARKSSFGYAACEYWLIRPPRIGRRWTRAVIRSTTSDGRLGGCWSNERCGRWPL